MRMMTQSRKPRTAGCKVLEQISTTALPEICELFWKFCRKVTEHMQVQLTVSVFFHVHLFQCTVYVFMTFSMTYVQYIKLPGVSIFDILYQCSSNCDLQTPHRVYKIFQEVIQKNV
jgi:hypothetical protein